MAKTQTAYFCRNCGAMSPKWLGRCNSCGEWNTMVEEVVQKESHGRSTARPADGRRPVPRRITEISLDREHRLDTRDGELNRVLGGGLVAGSLTLIGGEPGIGKSTLMLQVALKCAGQKVLYITGEESDQQIRMRSGRIGAVNEECHVLTETGTEAILRHLEEFQPAFVIVDSIQTLQTDTIESSAGSISQIRECAAELQKYAKQSGVPVFLIGHITKDGSLAGPKVLEHMVDTVLQFEGDRNYGYRILRSLKNRFGSTAELGIYEMNDTGLREVANPSEILLSHRDEPVSGIAIAAMMEGQRPLLIETQSLVSSAVYGTPQRSATGFDVRRLNMLLAVLEKRCGFKLGHKDVFLNIAGGIRVEEPAIDLAVVAAVLSSNQDIPIDSQTCFAAEVGLSGEIRSVNHVEQRIAEADKLGFDRILISKYNARGLDRKRFKIRVVPVAGIAEVYRELFG